MTATKVVDPDTASLDVGHSIWLDGPRESAEAVGARGYAYQPYVNAGTPVAIEPHVLILYMRGRTTIDRTIGAAIEHAEIGPGDLSLQSTASPALWKWADPIDVLHVYITPAHLRSMAQRAFDRNVSAVRLHNRLHVSDATLVQLGHDLIRELETPQAGSAIAAHAIGDRLLVQLLRQHAEIQLRDPNQAFDAKMVARLETYVAEHLSDRLELADLARITGYGVHHFCRVFRETFSQSPHDFVRQRRVEAAKDLLATTNQGVGDIALATGFADQSHLTRCFKQQVGVTPARWRSALA